MNQQELVSILTEMDRIQQLIIRYETLILALKTLGREEKQGMAGLAEDVFIPAGFPQRERVLVHIGVNIMLELSLEEAEAFYTKRIIALREALQALEGLLRTGGA